MNWFIPSNLATKLEFQQIEITELYKVPNNSTTPPCNRRAKIAGGLVWSELTCRETNNVQAISWTYRYLHSALRKIDFICYLFSHEHVRIFCFGEELIQYFQLRFGKSGSFTALLSWGPFEGNVITLTRYQCKSFLRITQSATIRKADLVFHLKGQIRQNILQCSTMLRVVIQFHAYESSTN